MTHNIIKIPYRRNQGDMAYKKDNALSNVILRIPGFMYLSKAPYKYTNNPQKNIA